MLKLLFYQVYSAEGMQTLFRGNSLASKTITYCFKAFGGNYLHTLLGPLIAPMYKEQVSFEVDPTRSVYKTFFSEGVVWEATMTLFSWNWDTVPFSTQSNRLKQPDG